MGIAPNISNILQGGGGGGAGSGITSITPGSPGVVLPAQPVDFNALYNDPNWGPTGPEMVGTPPWRFEQFIAVGPIGARPISVPSWVGTGWFDITVHPDLATLNGYAATWGLPATPWAADQWMPMAAMTQYATWNGTAFVARAEPVW